VREKDYGDIVEISPPQSFSHNVSYTFWELAGHSAYIPSHVIVMHRVEGMIIVCFSLTSRESGEFVGAYHFVRACSILKPRAHFF
jgi:hypothetical protein